MLKDDILGVQFLLSGIDDVDFQEMDEITPLRFAVKTGKAHFVQMLLHKGANVNVEEVASRRSILLDAIWSLIHNVGYPIEILRMALNCGANVDYDKYRGKTAAILAAEHGLSDVLNILLEYQPELDAADEEFGDTALHKTSSLNNVLILEKLLRLGAKIDIPNYHGVTPLFAAILNESFDAAEILLRWGANPNFNPGHDREVPFHIVCRDMDEGIVDFLMSYGSAVDAQNNKGQNALFYAAQNFQTSGPLELLLRHGNFDVNHRDRTGRTAIRGLGYDEMPISCKNASLLLEHGAFLNPEFGPLPVICANTEECALVMYFYKLWLLGADTQDCLTDKFCHRGAEESVFVIEISKHEAYLQELGSLNRITISLEPYQSLLDVILAKKNDLTKMASNQVIQVLYKDADGDFEEYFPHFGFVLNRVCKKIQERKNLLHMAGDSLCVAISFGLSDQILKKIFTELDDCDLATIAQLKINDEM